MRTLRDSSEIKEAAELLRDLCRKQGREGEEARREPVPEAPAAAEDVTPEKPAAPEAGGGAPAEEAPPAEKKELENPFVHPGGTYREDQLEHTLEVMCRRGGFKGAVLADEQGLPLAVFRSPVAPEVIAAFTSVAGEIMEKAQRMLAAPGANNLSMDVNYEDKVVLRRFDVGGRFYFLMVICPQAVDERGEQELTIEQVTSILS